MMKPSNTYPRTNRLVHQLQQETASEEERLDISPRMRRHGSLTMNSNLFRHLRHNSPFNLPLYGDDNNNNGSSNSVLSNDRFMAILDEAIAISDEHCRRSRGLRQFSSKNIGEGQEDQDNSTTKKQ